VEGRAVSERDAALLKKLGPFMVAVLVLSSLSGGSAENIALMCAFAVLIYFYSAEPVRLKEKPILDSVANGFFYFFAPFALGYTFGAPLATMSTAAAVLLITCAAGLHALAAIADYEPDREVRNRTIAVALGRKSAATFALACFFVNFLFNWPMLILMMVGVFAAGAVINIITDRWTVMVMRFTIIWGVATVLLYLVGSVLLQNI
jgi:4-hydroxybenzoate polyprenyltransferase